MKFKNILVAFSTLLIFTLVLNSCYYDQIVPRPPDLDSVGPQTFSGDIIPIFNQSCNNAGCHNGAVRPDLRPANAYNALINGGYINTDSPESSELYQWMKGNRSIPMPTSGPNSDYNNRILRWITDGALNN
ncbi:hypothetical protein [Cognataquiflexum rubidum]|uniref:hypothetical protein n=1 Tax=Cognataquiflexum rubidum TaxID=2922273 RepID=UPI001F12AEAD|nr:hypothetical protein [Cognataquiflexum rubidum]MCH6232612.1 hypothetical protein [Cognataquiflexum rubidum]